MRIVDKPYFIEYDALTGRRITHLMREFDVSEKSSDLGYKTQASAVFSSNIEGNSMDLNSYMNYKLSAGKLNGHKEVKEIENLIDAYEFAQSNVLNEQNFLTCHKKFSKTLVIKSQQGNYRNDQVGVFSAGGLVYLAIEPQFVKETMRELFDDITTLLSQDLSDTETFYFAALIHLNFAHIHPFLDGNGRAARLLEKWFLAAKLGPELWKVPSEKYYKEHQPDYYGNINLGVNYYELNYARCIPFLLMLPKAMEKE